MSVDLVSLPLPLIESVLCKMDYKSFTRMRGTSRGIGDFIRRRRHQIPVSCRVFSLQFSQNGTYIRPSFYNRPYLLEPEAVVAELPFIRPHLLEFRSLGMLEIMKCVRSVKSHGIGELIVSDISEPAVIYISSVLRPKVLSSENIEFQEDILFQPGFQDLDTIRIKSPQEFIDLSPCQLKIKELVVDLSYGDCPERDILRLLKMWERGEGRLNRLEFQFDEEFENLDLCAEIIQQCAADPLFIREIHDVGPLSWIGMEKFKNPHYDRLMVMSSRAQIPQTAVILFQRGKFIFEATESMDLFFDALNKHGNAIFVDNFRLNYRIFIAVQRLEA